MLKDGTETLDLQFVPVHPEPKMFVPQAQKTMHLILTQNEISEQPWMRRKTNETLCCTSWSDNI